MKKDVKSRFFIIYISVIHFLLLLVYSLSVAYGLPTRLHSEFSKSQKQSSYLSEETRNIALEEGKTLYGPPLYSEVEFSSIVGEIFVNPGFSGRIGNVRTLLRNGLPGGKPGVEVTKSRDGWERIIVHESEFNARSFIATGEKGTLKVTVSDKEAPSESDKIKSLNELTIGFGQLKATFLAPITISQPSSFGIEVLDYNGGQFISGEVIAVKDNEIAIKFENLPSSVVSKDGTIRVSLKESNERFLNADLKAWGYNLLVPETDVGMEAPIKAEVFGLPGEAQVKFIFTPLSGQEITPLTRTLTVQEINSGEPLATLVTSIPGAQPLSVSVEKIGR
jgi:hypothetical protein